MNTVPIVAEVLSYIATIILVGVSVYALKQLKIAKDALEVQSRTLDAQSRREARKISMEYVYIFMEHVMAYRGEIELSSDSQKILETFRYSGDEENGLDIEAIKTNDKKVKLDTAEARKEYADKLDKAYKPYADLLNEIEAFAFAVTSGVMDEKMLYRTLGQYYVNLIDREHLDQIIQYLASKKNLYTNVTELYALWKLRLTARELQLAEKENATVAEEIKRIKDEIGDVEERAIRPIGVDDKLA